MLARTLGAGTIAILRPETSIAGMMVVHMAWFELTGKVYWSPPAGQE